MHLGPQNPGKVWVRRDLKAHPIPCNGVESPGFMGSQSSFALVVYVYIFVKDKSATKCFPQTSSSGTLCTGSFPSILC